MVLLSASSRMDIQLYNIYGYIVTGDHHTKKTFFSIELNAVVRNRSLQTGTSSTFLASLLGAMKAVRLGESVSITLTDHIGNFEPHVAWRYKVMNVGGSAESTYSVQGKVDQQWCVTENVFRSLHANAILQPDVTT